MSILKSIFSKNTSFGGGAMAIFAGSTMNIEYSTIDSNSVTEGGDGGGLINNGTLSLMYSAITRNQTNGSGGGISSGGGSTSIFRSTISGNSAVTGSAGLYSVGSSKTSVVFSNITNNSGGPVGGAFVTGPVSILGSIIAGNEFRNCFLPMTSAGYNLSDDSSCGFTQSTDLENTDPVLGPLANNGGPTEAQALRAGSPAIDTGGTTGCSPTDQRGVPAPQNLICDRGAFEVKP